MIKYSKCFLVDPAQINIHNIYCGGDNIAKVADIFDFKQVIMQIPDLPVDSSLIAFVKEKGLKYFIEPNSMDDVCLSVVVHYSLFKVILEKVVNEEPNCMWICNLKNLTTWDAYLQNQSFSNLIEKGIIDVTLFVWFDEFEFGINVRKTFIQPKDLYKKIKSIPFE